MCFKIFSLESGIWTQLLKLLAIEIHRNHTESFYKGFAYHFNRDCKKKPNTQQISWHNPTCIEYRVQLDFQIASTYIPETNTFYVVIKIFRVKIHILHKSSLNILKQVGDVTFFNKEDYLISPALFDYVTRVWIQLLIARVTNGTAGTSCQRCKSCVKDMKNSIFC